MTTIKKCSKCETILNDDNVYHRQNGRASGMCRDCESEYNKALNGKNGHNGYNGHCRRPGFVMPPGCKLLPGWYNPKLVDDPDLDDGLPLLREPKTGRPVVKVCYGDLGPGEVNYVLR